MFKKFIEYVGCYDGLAINSVEEFQKEFGGKTFFDGLYRLFKFDEINKWNKILGDAFPQAANNVYVFGYDWMGRIFAIVKATNIVYLFEPGTGKFFCTDEDIEEFHDVELVESKDDALNSLYFYEWSKRNNNYRILQNECVGYKIPLFLNGEDDFDNLEVSDMEVYWEIMMPLLNL